MKTIRAAIFAACALGAGGVCSAAGLMTPKGSDGPSLAMKEHRVVATIDNGYAMTEVEQVFSNPHDTDLEAIYSFPLPKAASLSELSLWIDGKEISGEVVEKEKVRKIYEEEKKAGRDSALAEKDDYRTFEVYVYPVRAHDETRVRLVYYQPVTVESCVGRYVYPLAEGGVDEVRKAFWTAHPHVESGASFDLTLKSAYPVADVRVPGHEADAAVTRVSDGVYTVSLKTEGGHDLTRDIVFYYRLAENTPARLEMVPYKADPASPGTFMLLLTPGVDLQPIREGSDWVFVLDRSGSMAGKIGTLAEGVSQAIRKMRPEDRFRIVIFNQGASELTRGYLPATRENVEEAIRQVKGLEAEGSTDMYDGIALGLKGLDNDRTTTFIVVTDGVANTGRISHRDFVELLRKCDVRFFAFVMGNSANWPLMERIAKETGGTAAGVSNDDDIVGQILLAKGKITHEALHDVRLSIDGVRTYDVAPKAIGNLYRGEQLVLFGHYAQGGTARVTMRARISGEEKEYAADVVFPDVDRDNPELERLWAYAAIDELMQQIRYEGEESELISAVVGLGTNYSLVTDYTSMVVVMSERQEELGLGGANRGRIERERAARAARAASGEVRCHRADASSPMFGGATAPGIGVGAIDPLTGLFAALMGAGGLLASRAAWRRG